MTTGNGAIQRFFCANADAASSVVFQCLAGIALEDCMVGKDVKGQGLRVDYMVSG